MKKRIIALVLTVIMLVGTFPISSFATFDEQSSSVSAETQLRATNSVGSIMKETLDEANEKEQSSDYIISEASVEDNKINCRATALEQATLIVAFYDENTEQMLKSISCTVTNQKVDYSLNLPSGLPENYLVKLFLVGEKGEPLCDGYIYREKTTEFARFLSQTTEDFEKELVVNFDESESNNFLVLGKDTIIVDGNQQENKLESYNIEKGEYTFSNVNDTIKNLKKDDVFRYNGEDGELQVIKVEKIETKGDRVTVFAQEAKIEDVFEYAKIDTTAGTNDFKEFGEGEDYLETVDYEQFKAGESGQKKAPKRISGSESKNIFAKTFKLNKTVGKVKINGEAALKIDANVKYYLFDGNNSITFTITPTAYAKFSTSGSLDIINFNLKGLSVTIYGVEISLVPTFKLSIDGKIETSAEISCVLGFEWSEKNGFVNKSEKPKLTTKLEAEATVYVGLFISPVVTIGIGELSLEKLVHASLTAEFSVQDKLTYSASNEKEVKTHDCDVCLDGSVTNSIIVTGEVQVIKTWSKKLYNHKGELFHHYISLSKGQAGLGYCPYRYYPVKLTVKSNGIPVSNINISLGGGLIDSNGDYILDSSSAKTNSQGVLTAYFKPGTYGLVFSGDEYQSEIRTITVAAANKVQSMKLDLHKMSEDTDFNGEYQNGDVILFGRYPQTQVQDRELLAKFANMEFEWSTLGYDKVKYDNKLYCEFNYENNKYRGVKDAYNNIKFFIYEPIEWKMIDEDYGLFISAKVLDTAPLNKDMVEGDDGYYHKVNQPELYAGYYSDSDYRSWLNSSFYDTAFNDLEKNKIKSPWIFTFTDGSIKQNSITKDDPLHLLSKAEVNDFEKRDFNVWYATSTEYVDNYSKEMFIKNYPTQWYRDNYKAYIVRSDPTWYDGEVFVMNGVLHSYMGSRYRISDGYEYVTDDAFVRPAIRLNLTQNKASQKVAKKFPQITPFSLRGNIVTIENAVKDNNYMVYKFKNYSDKLDFSSDNLLYVDCVKAAGGDEDFTLNPISGSGKVVVCGDFGSGAEIAVNGTPHEHSFEETSAKAPTCTESGEITQTCTVCGKIETTVTPALGHRFDSGKVTTKATCAKNGVTTYTCSVCSATKTETIKATGKHTFTAWKVTQKATYTATGTKTRTCTVCGKTETQSIAKLKSTAITKCQIKLSLSSAAYTGKALKPTVTVKNGKTTLKAGTHYTVTYKNNTKIGKATVTITGIAKNGYSGTKTLTFNIIPANVKNLKATQTTNSVTLSWSKVAGAKGYRVYKYDTKTKKWVKVADTTKTTYTIKKLKAGTSYKYAVKAYAAVSKTTYWSASYAQFSTATKPATPTLKATAGKKQAALSWNKVSGASGYVVYMATGKNGSFKKVATIKKGSTVKYTKKSLKKGTTYKFKIMSYKTVSGKNIYSGYSAVKTVKAK